MGNHLDRWTSQAARKWYPQAMHVACRVHCGICKPPISPIFAQVPCHVSLHSCSSIFQAVICNLDCEGSRWWERMIKNQFDMGSLQTVHVFIKGGFYFIFLMKIFFHYHRFNLITKLIEITNKRNMFLVHSVHLFMVSWKVKLQIYGIKNMLKWWYK